MFSQKSLEIGAAGPSAGGGVSMGALVSTISVHIQIGLVLSQAQAAVTTLTGLLFSSVMISSPPQPPLCKLSGKTASQEVLFWGIPGKARQNSGMFGFTGRVVMVGVEAMTGAGTGAEVTGTLTGARVGSGTLTGTGTGTGAKATGETPPGLMIELHELEEPVLQRYLSSPLMQLQTRVAEAGASMS